MPTAYVRRVHLKASFSDKGGNLIVSKSKRLIPGILLTLVIAGLPAAVLGDGGDPSLIHACVNPAGSVRIIGAAESCRRSESPVHWPAGGTAGQVCPSGQFVTGFDSAGQLICASPCPSELAQATLTFEEEGIDLETGAIISDFFFFPVEVDFHFAFNGDRPNPIVLFQDNGAEIAFFDGTPFDIVDCSVIGSLTFTGDLIDVPFDFDDTVVIKTADGNVFKVGKPVENGDNSVTFSYARLQ